MLSSLIPSPLHPAIVHLPIALTVLVPLFAVGALVAIRRGSRPLTAWGLTTAMTALLSLSAFVSLQTGEAQEDTVEPVVAEQALHTHEEAADVFLGLSLGVLAIAALGLAPKRVGAGARLVATVGTIALLGAGWRVGHSGGELVYRYNAGAAYAQASGPGVPTESPARTGDDH